MKIAVVDPFPGKAFTAEREFIQRLCITASRLGWSCQVVNTSQDIMTVSPDLVLATHEYVPKLTGFPTVGLLWSPPSFFSDCEIRKKNILSYDGFLPGSEPIASWADALSRKWEKHFIPGPAFFPSSFETPWRPYPGKRPCLFYAGAHWDGQRFGGLFSELHAMGVPLSLHGPEQAWSHVPNAYKGEIASDGRALIETAARAGIALCLHKREHRQWNVPSMRLFEAAAASCVLIADDMQFTREYFSDSVLYVETDSSPKALAEQIAAHVNWVQENPALANDMARESHTVFCERLALERLLQPLPNFLQKLRSQLRYTQSGDALEPEIAVIIRIGGRSSQTVSRAVASVAEQSHRAIRLLMVQYADVPGLDAVLDAFGGRFRAIERIDIRGERLGRSGALWAGLRQVSSAYFCNLDDDDQWHPNHLRLLLSHLQTRADCDLAYGGLIAYEEDSSAGFDQRNLRELGKKNVLEARRFAHFRQYDQAALWGFDNYIGNCSWLAKRAVLSKIDLNDPQLDYLEDVFLYQLFNRHSRFVFSPHYTSQWNLRTQHEVNASSDRIARKAQRNKAQRLSRSMRPQDVRAKPWYVRSLKQLLSSGLRWSYLLLRNPSRAWAQLRMSAGDFRAVTQKRGLSAAINMALGR